MQTSYRNLISGKSYDYFENKIKGKTTDVQEAQGKDTIRQNCSPHPKEDSALEAAAGCLGQSAPLISSHLFKSSVTIKSKPNL